MGSWTPVRRSVACAVMVAVCAPAAFGQVNLFPPDINTEQNPLRNVRLSGTRAPGIMVNAGVVRTLSAANFAQDVIEITEPLPEPDPKATFLSDAIEIVFEQLNNAILLFENALRLRAGLPPRVPIDIPTDGDTTDGDTTNGDTTDSVDEEDVADVLDQLNGAG